MLVGAEILRKATNYYNSDDILILDYGQWNRSPNKNHKLNNILPYF